MRRKCRNLLALFLAATYLGVVSLGHFFHNHGPAGHGGCGCAAASRHHHEHEGCACHGQAHSRLLASNSHTHGTQASHCCPICQFYSHHGAWVDADEAPMVEPLSPSVIRRISTVPVEIVFGPQQPRAPPLST